MSAPKSIFCLSLMGLSLVWSPLYGTSESQVFPALASYPAALFWARIVSLVSLCIACAAFCMLHKYSSQKRPRPITVMATSTIVYAIGIAMGVACGLTLSGTWSMMVGAALRGFAFLPIIVCWLSLFSRNDSRDVAAAIFLGLGWYAIFGVAAFALSGLSPYAVGAALVLTPFIALGGYAAFEPKGKHSESKILEASALATIPKPTLAKLLVANLAFGVVYGSLMFCFSTLTSYGSLSFFMLTAFAMAVFSLRYFEKHSPGELLRIIALVSGVLSVVAIMVSAHFSEAGLYPTSAFLVLIIFYSLSIFNDAEMGAAGNDWVIMSACMLCAGLGIICCCLIFHASSLHEVSANAVLVMGLAGITFISALFSPNPKQEISTWGFSSMEPKESDEAKRLKRCEEIALAANLTSRELEVLQLLSTGQGRDEVAETLVISPHTAKTHIRNVYAKLDIHNSRELERLFK